MNNELNEQVSSNTEIVSNEVSSNDTISNGKKCNKKLVITLCSIGVLLIVAACLYLFVFNSPKRVFKNAIKSIKDDVKDISEEFSDDSFNLKGNLSITENNEKVSFDYELGLDSKKEKALATILLKQNNSSFNAQAYLEKNTLYLKLKDVFDDVLKIDLGNSLEYEKSKFSKDDINYLIDAISKILIKELDVAKFSKDSKTIKINNKDVSFIDNKMVIDKKDGKKVAEIIYNDIKNDDKLIKFLSEITGVEESYIKENMNDFDNADLPNDLELHIYTSKFLGKIVGFGFSGIEFYSNGSTKYANVSEMIKLEGANGKYELSFNPLISNDKVYIEEKDKNVKISFKSDNDEYTINLKLDDKKDKIELSLLAKSNGNTSEIKFDCVKEDLKDIKFDTSNSIDAMNLSSEKQEELLSKINDFVENNDFLKKFASLLEEKSYDYNEYDYDYDFDSTFDY